MAHLKHSIAILLAAAEVLPAPLVHARTAAGDRYFAQGRALESGQKWDEALAAFEKALAEDTSELVYKMAVFQARAKTAQARAEQTRKPTPADRVREEARAERERLLSVPKLRPLRESTIDLTLREQSSKIMFETVGKYAGINVLFDPEYQPGKSLSVDLTGSTLSQALDYLALLTKSFWKPISSNAIFVSNDNPNKRRDYEDQVSRTFYLTNVNTAQELQELVNAVRTVTELQRVASCSSQFAIAVRGEADKVALAGKLISDFDKPRTEVVVDLMVIEISKSFSRTVTAALASTGISTGINFTPRSSIAVATSSSTSSSSSSDSSSSSSSVSLASLRHLSSSDFSTTLPGAVLALTLSDGDTKILQSPQIRTVSNQKASLKIGNRQPIATGSYSAGTNTTATSALVNTQFSYLDVGVNVDVTAHVHDNRDVSLHIELEISNVNSYVDLGGIEEPVIGQRKVVHDIRMKEGEVGLLGGLTDDQETKKVTGIPGLSSIPVIRRLFTGSSVDRSRSELMIALVPHIVRSPEVSPENLRPIAVGSGSAVRLNYGSPAEQK